MRTKQELTYLSGADASRDFFSKFADLKQDELNGFPGRLEVSMVTTSHMLRFFSLFQFFSSSILSSLSLRCFFECLPATCSSFNLTGGVATGIYKDLNIPINGKPSYSTTVDDVVYVIIYDDDDARRKLREEGGEEGERRQLQIHSETLLRR